MKFINKEEYGKYVYFQDSWTIQDYFNQQGRQKISLLKNYQFEHTRYTSSWPNTIAHQATFHLGQSIKYGMEQWINASQANTHLSLLGENQMDFYLAKQTIRQKNPLLFVDGSACHDSCKALIDECIEQGVTPYLIDYNHFLDAYPDYQRYQSKFQHLPVKSLKSFLINWSYRLNPFRFDSEEYRQLQGICTTLMQSLDDCFVNFSFLRKTLNELQNSYPLVYQQLDEVLIMLEKLNIFIHYDSTTTTPVIPHLPLFEKNTAIIISLSPKEQDFLEFLSSWLYWHISHALGTDLTEGYRDVIETGPAHFSYIKSLIFRQINLSVAPHLTSMARALRCSMMYSIPKINDIDESFRGMILPNTNTVLFFPSQNNDLRRIYHELMGEHILGVHQANTRKPLNPELIVPFEINDNEFIVFNRYEFQRLKFNDLTQW